MKAGSQAAFDAAAEHADNDQEPRPSKADLVRQAIRIIGDIDTTETAIEHDDNECLVREATEVLEDLLDWLELTDWLGPKVERRQF